MLRSSGALRRIALAPLLATFGLLVSASTALATHTITVNTTSDASPSANECSNAPNDCSLRQAIDNAQPGDTP